VAHGDSRGEKAGPIRLKSPGRGGRPVLMIADLLSPLRGSARSLCVPWSAGNVWKNRCLSSWAKWRIPAVSHGSSIYEQL